VNWCSSVVEGWYWYLELDTLAGVSMKIIKDPLDAIPFTLGSVSGTAGG